MLAAAATAEAAASSCWSDLPFELLRDVSCRFHTAADYACFHAVCKPWLDTLPAACRPVFLPWLLMATDKSGHRTARCVFSSCTCRRRCGFATGEIRLRDRRWVVSAGTAAWLLTACPAADPLTGSASIVPVPVPDEQRWTESAAGIVSGDGTIFLHGLGVDSYIYAALLRPGGTEWTLARRRYMYHPREKDMYRPCFAYHNGNIVGCHGRWWSVLFVEAQGTDDDIVTGVMGDEPGKVFQSSYVLESGGELLWAWVQIKTTSSYHKDLSEEHPYGCLGSLAVAWSVSVYALQDADGELRWVKRDGESLGADRVLFLGQPRSFAVDAVRVGISGGCAYFVDTRNLFAGAWSKWPLTRGCVYRYSFLDDESELVQELPPQWNHKACMWITPQPAIATTQATKSKQTCDA